MTLLQIVHHDPEGGFAVVDKPSGLLSCPGRDPSLHDSVQTRVPLVFPQATGSILAHRLDQWTSGLMVVALDVATHRNLRVQFERANARTQSAQRSATTREAGWLGAFERANARTQSAQRSATTREAGWLGAFEARTVEKVYEAELVGDVVGDHGLLALPFRLDVDRRPHQIYDLVHGKLGLTRWRVLRRTVIDVTIRNMTAHRTRVAFEPHTGRTHQLRTHAAHPLGLNAAIAGDALYGDPSTSPRLLLHARELRFDHPVTGARLTFTSPTPF